MQSGITEVEYDSDIQPPARRKSGYRVISSDVEVKISYWQSLKSVLMPWQTKTRKITTELQIVDPEEDMDDNNENVSTALVGNISNIRMMLIKDSSIRPGFLPYGFCPKRRILPIEMSKR